MWPAQGSANRPCCHRVVAPGQLRKVDTGSNNPVRNGQNCPKAAAAAKFIVCSGRWFTESSRAGIAVPGNHPFSVMPFGVLPIMRMNPPGPEKLNSSKLPFSYGPGHRFAEALRAINHPSGGKAAAANAAASRVILDQGRSCCRSSWWMRWWSTTPTPAAAVPPCCRGKIRTPGGTR